MKKLIFVRHGKSSWEEDVPDEDRPLKKRAYKDADLVINAFKEKNIKGCSIWSSFANRALTTARIFQEELQIPDDHFRVRNDLYTFNGNQLIDVISTCEDSVDCLMVFGHNPAITHSVNKLGDHNFENVPTTGLVMLEFETDKWKSLKNGKTLLYLFPKNLK